MRFVSSLMVAGSVPDAAAKLAAGQNPYPWIKDPRVLEAMGELEKLNELSQASVEFKLPNALDKFVLGYGAPAPAKVSESYTLNGDPFWKTLSGPRSKGAIREALKKAESVLHSERAIEPRRQQLVKLIKDITGEDPWLLRLEPQMAAGLKKVVADLKLEMVPTENMMPHLEEGVATLQRYWRAYTNGTLNAFESEEHSRAYHRGYDYEGRNFEKKKRDSLKGDDYVPSEKETQSSLNALKHFLNLASTHIDSTAGLPAAYTATIHNRKDVRNFIRSIAWDAYGNKEGSKFMQITEHAKPIEASWASGRFNSPGYVTISDPPLELMEMIEEARKKKKQSVSRQY